VWSILDEVPSSRDGAERSGCGGGMDAEYFCGGQRGVERWLRGFAARNRGQI